MSRELGGEKKEIQVKHGKRWYRITVAWHLTDSDFRYCYAHVFVNGYSKPIHHWNWVADLNGKFLGWAP